MVLAAEPELIPAGELGLIPAAEPELMAAALRGSEQRLPSQLTPVVVLALELRVWLMPPASKSRSRQNCSNRNR